MTTKHWLYNFDSNSVRTPANLNQIAIESNDVEFQDEMIKTQNFPKTNVVRQQLIVQWFYFLEPNAYFWILNVMI